MKTEIEFDLEYGNTVVCANCPQEIRKGDPYVIHLKWMFCSEECADEAGEGWLKEQEESE